MKRLQAVLCRILTDHLARGGPALVPEAGAIFWTCFAEVSAQRGRGEGGAQPLRIADVMTWAELRRIPFGPRHVALVLALDLVFLDYLSAGVGARGAPVVPLTGDLFDRTFG